MRQKPSKAHQGARERTSWPLVLVLILAGVAAAFQVGKAPPVLRLIQSDLKMDLFLAGWILSTFSIIGLLMGAASGAAADALGHRRMLLAGLFILATGSLVGGIARHAWLFFGTRILEGLGFLLVIVTAPTLIVRVTHSRDMRLALSGWSCFIPFGVSLIMLFAPVLTMNFGWRGLWIINGMILIASALITSRLTGRLTHPKAERRVTPARILKDIITTSTTMGPALLTLIFSTYTLQWLAVMGFLPTLLMEEYTMSLGRASILTALVVALNVPGNLSGGWLMSRGARRSNLIIAASLIMGACSLLIYGSAFPFSLRYAGCLMFSASGGLLPAAVLSGAPTHAPREDLVATTNGLLMQGSQLGQTVGPPALALLVSRYGGWHVAPWPLCTAALIGIALSFYLAYLERKSKAGAA